MHSIIVSLVMTIIIASGIFLPDAAFAFSLENPEQTGIALNLGSSYDPDPTFRFAQLSLMALYDYEQIMSHPAPEALRFKIEGSVGAADVSSNRAMVALNIFALYYLSGLSHGDFKPYVEAGIGIAYNDFQVEGQGVRFNFNPQAGIGTEWQMFGAQHWYSALRAYHLSNGNLHSDNRGINGVLFQVGVSF